MEDVPQFGRLVRAHRSRIGLTQRELADFSTISVRAIRDLEQGKARRPRHDTVRLIADGLRLGPKARTALQTAANQGSTSWALKAAYDAEPPAPPIAAHPIIGRDQATETLHDELATGAERLINVVGLAGTGKTRLALEVATRMHAASGFPVLWYAFPGATDDYHRVHGSDLAAVLHACATDLFGTGSPGVEPTTGSIAELVGDEPALLVLDGAGHHVRTDRLAALQRGCPQLRIIITSEQPYAVAGERVFVLDPLRVPTERDAGDPDRLGQVPAARLFLDEIRRIRPDYALTRSDTLLVVEVCRLLDGIPAALRAAASWLVVYDLETLCQCLIGDPDGLLNHLSGADGTVRVREALDRQVRALPAADAALLSTLCATGDEFSLDDVVQRTGLSLPDCGRALRDLLLRSLVCPGPSGGRPRFRVLNLVRAVQLTTGSRYHVAAA